MPYVDARGNYVAQRGFDHRSGTAIPVPPAVFPVIGSLKLDAARADPVSGLVRIDDGLFLITSRPILTSEVQGPFRGRLILGRRFDQTEMDHLGRITSLKVRLLDASDRSAASPRVTLNEGSVTGRAHINDVFGRPIAAFEISRTSELFDRGAETRRLLILYVALTIVGVLTIVTIHRYVVRPVTRVATAARDITNRSEGLVPEHGPAEITNMASAINEMLNTLRATTDNLVRAESFRAISRLSAGISHNLNNILTGILGPAEVIKTEPINEEVRTHIETIQRAATRAADLVRRLNAAVTPPSPGSSQAPIDPTESVRSAVEVTRSQWHDRAMAQGRVFEVSTSLASTRRVSIPDGILQNILVNLIVNAIEAQPGGGAIGLSTVDRGDRVEIAVVDSGPGVDEASLPHIFEPLMTSDARVGRGLGLAWVYSAVTESGGVIDVQSSPAGTRFTLTLPTAIDPSLNEPLET